MWGERPIVVLDEMVRLPASTINCRGATVLIGPNTRSSGGVIIDARNGGQILVEGDNLWAGGVRLHTDDMHSIVDKATGKRLNAFGGSIHIETHVWLALDALVTGTVRIGRDSVVGARAVVTRDVDNETVVAGVPAKVIRRGVSWSGADHAP
jgi:acetyltransferase-like isoleucine patch superfamily enzyme